LNQLLVIAVTVDKTQPGSLKDRALVEPVMVTRNGRERVVLISADELGSDNHWNRKSG
jgi:hypothetical protein